MAECGGRPYCREGRRAQAREIALSIACDTHPIGNLSVPEKLRTEYGANDTSGGYNLRAGNPFGTGAISGPAQNSSGSIMESTLGGRSRSYCRPTKSGDSLRTGTKCFFLRGRRGRASPR
jgi:hypothetical protein